MHALSVIHCEITYILCAVLNESNVTCAFLTRDDYISILWTAVAEVPGNVHMHRNFASSHIRPFQINRAASLNLPHEVVIIDDVSYYFRV